MTATELAGYLTDYAGSFAAPVHEHSPVRSLEQAEDGYAVRTNDDALASRQRRDRHRVVRRAPRAGRGRPARPDHRQVTTSSYRNPDELPDGRVLVVGASATGVQLADELARAGRDVVLAVGRHSRLPRCYRGVDIWWWLDQIGTFARTIDQVSDPARSRREGSVQLAGRADHRDVDLPALQRLGVRLAGRLVGVDGARVGSRTTCRSRPPPPTRGSSGSSTRSTATSVRSGWAPTCCPRRRGVRSTSPSGRRAGPPRRAGRRRRLGHRVHPALPVAARPRARPRGEITQRRGVTPHAGLYVLGQRFQHRSDSNFIDGVRHDAAHVARHIASRLQSHEPIAS